MPADRRLLIIGAGGLGRELESWLDRVPEHSRDWKIHGYLDDNPDALAGFPSDYTVLSGLDTFAFVDTDLAILAIGQPKWKRAAVARLEGRVEFLTFTGPGALVGKHVNIGRGCVIGMDCMLTTNIDVGDFVTINSRSTIGHDVRIGSYSSLIGNVMVSGDCSVGQDVYVGSSATLIQGRRVGDRAVIAAGAVAFRHVRADTTVVGNPARVFLGHGNSPS